MQIFSKKKFALSLTAVLAFVFTFGVLAFEANAQDSPSIVRPGAPGQATRVLPSDTRGQITPIAKKDVEFMQGMIHHHAQAIEMTDLIESRTDNADVRRLGSRISQSQADEMNMMRRWLGIRGFPAEMEMPKAPKPAADGHDSHGGHHPPKHEHHDMMMPGMLTKAQMDALRAAKGKEFDRLFLSGMIQHHIGALVMVKELFDTAGAGQDAELFNFATDVDTSQRAEIRIMQQMLDGIKDAKDHKSHDHH